MWLNYLRFKSIVVLNKQNMVNKEYYKQILLKSEMLTLLKFYNFI